MITTSGGGSASTPGQISSSQKAPCFNIVDGSPTADFPAAYALMAKLGTNLETCTGFFISDNTLVTAAHCVPYADLSALHLVGNSALQSLTLASFNSGVPPLRFFVDPSLQPRTGGLFEVPKAIGLDIAILIFPDQTSTAAFKLPSQALAAQSPVTLVGYGREDQAVSTPFGSSLRKKSGANTASMANSDPTYYTIAGWEHPGEAAAAGHPVATYAEGDSGAPMLVGDTAYAVLHGSATVENNPNLPQLFGSDNVNYLASLSTDFFRQLLARAQAGGARLGVSGAPHRCP